MTKNSSVVDIIKYLTTLINSMEVIPTAGTLPSYAKLKESPDKFYEMFSEATYKYNIICDTLQKLQHAHAVIIRVMSELQDNVSSREPYSSRAQYIKTLTSIKASCMALINAYETAKASAESIVKYYNNAQFVITSSRFDSTSAAY